MTVEETALVLEGIRVLWPHSKLGDNPEIVLRTWHHLLRGVDRGEAEAAISELAATGREHAPLPGVVLKTVGERRIDSPDWDEAWVCISKLIRRFGYMRVPPADAFSHPVVAAFARPTWRELCTGPAAGTDDFGTHYAQQRDAYRALRARQQRDTALDHIGAPRRRAAARQVDFAAAIGAPAGAIVIEQQSSATAWIEP